MISFLIKLFRRVQAAQKKGEQGADLARIHKEFVELLNETWINILNDYRSED